MDELIMALYGLDKILIMGNSPNINDLDPVKVDNMMSIGVCRIGLKYHPDVLLWTENINWMGRGNKEDYLKILIETKSPVKICRDRKEALLIPESPDYSFFKFKSIEKYGHEWQGGLRHGPSVCTAIHLAMVCHVKEIFVAGVDYASNKYFWGGEQWGSTSGEYKRDDFRAASQYYKMIHDCCDLSVIKMCSPVCRIPYFEITDELNL